MLEYFRFPVSETEDAHVPFPLDLPLAERDAYMAAPPVDVLADCVRLPRVTPAAPSAPVPAPAPVVLDALTLATLDEE